MSTTPTPQPRKLSVEQAAAQCGCHPETIRRAIRKHELLANQNRLRPGSPFEILQTDLTDFKRKRGG